MSQRRRGVHTADVYERALANIRIVVAHAAALSSKRIAIAWRIAGSIVKRFQIASIARFDRGVVTQRDRRRTLQH